MYKMIDIIFLIDFEPGHIYPTFKLADSLSEAGFKVCFAGPADGRKIVEKHGFDYHEVFKDLYPEGSSGDDMVNKHYTSLLSGSLDQLIEKLGPKLIMVSSYMHLESLILFYKYNVKLITYCPSFLEGVSEKDLTLDGILINNCLKIFFSLSGEQPQMLLKLVQEKNKSLKDLKDIFQPIEKIPKMVLCPKELRVNETSKSKKEIYLGPGIIENNPSEEVSFKEFLPENKQLIFVSMGSQIKKYPDRASQLFKMATSFMQLPHCNDFHMFLTVGGTGISNWNLGTVPENVSVFNWLPQKEVLKMASAAIIHGGLGTIKECIFFGVPMLIVPMGRDQMDNAERVSHHKLGVKVNLEETNVDQLSKAVHFLMVNSEVRTNVAEMRTVFTAKNDNAEGVHFIKEYISAS